MPDFEKILNLPSPLEPFVSAALNEKSVKVFVKRDDLIHPEISGNKWRKLKYHLLHAQKEGYKRIVSFGGAYSNHIYALAAAGKYFGVQTAGIIRGDELNPDASSTLRFAKECGMALYFVSREQYRRLRNDIRLAETISDSLKGAFVIPEGGTTTLALDGVGEMVEEIITQLGYDPDYIICPVGTGGTIAGILSRATEKTTVMGICVLKNGFYLENEIRTLLQSKRLELPISIRIFWDYHQGGYAKKTPQLMQFVEEFNAHHAFAIEPVYSGKMFLAFDQLLKNHINDNSTVVLVHTGGIQPVH